MAGVRGFPGRGRRKFLGLFFPLKTTFSPQNILYVCDTQMMSSAQARLLLLCISCSLTSLPAHPGLLLLLEEEVVVEEQI